MENDIKKSKSTSMRQFLLDVLKPSPSLSTLGKRGRSDDLKTHESEVQSRSSNYTSRKPTAPSYALNPATKPNCIALQNEDTAEDAIVITALNVVPFCCHADLMTMTRPELLRAASVLNAKLPRALHIDVSPARSDRTIRHAIEDLVGLRNNVSIDATNPDYKRPHLRDTTSPAPKLTRLEFQLASPSTPESRPFVRREPLSSVRISSSPLTRRTRPSMSFGSPVLAMVREVSGEREDVSISPKPPQKKRRTDAPITRALSYHIKPFLGGTGTDVPPPPQGSPRVRGSIPLARTLSLDGGGSMQAQKKSPKKVKGGSRYSRARSWRAHANGMTSTPKRGGDSPTKHTLRSLLGDKQNTVGRAGGARSIFKKTRLEPGMDWRVGKRVFEDSTEASLSVKMEDISFGIDGMTLPYGEASDVSLSYGF